MFKKATALIVNYSILFTAAAVFFLHKPDSIVVLIISVCLHEISHYLAARLFGEKITSLHPSMVGFKMQGSHGLCRPHKIIPIALAGPLCNLLLMGVFHFFGQNMYALSNGVMAGLNLLPVLPLDGGQILFALMNIFTSKKKAIGRIKLIGKLISFVIIFLGIGILYVTKVNFTLLAVGVFLYYYAENIHINTFRQ